LFASDRSSRRTPCRQWRRDGADIEIDVDLLKSEVVMSNVPAEIDALLAASRTALDRGDWTAARASFEASLQREETAEALLGLSDALWWLGDTYGAVRFAERSYAAFRRRPDFASAALAAVSLYFHYRVSLGNAAAAHGWLARAARLVEEFELAPLEGWVLLLRAHDTGDPAAAERWARRRS
jgi:hypothetical protein